MSDFKPFRKGRDKVEDWLERFCRVLEDNPWFGKLMSGAMVPKSEKHRFAENATLDGSLTVTAGTTLEGGVIINDLGADVDLRVESNDVSNMFNVDGGENCVTIGCAPISGHSLDVQKPADAPTIIGLIHPNITGGGFSAQASCQIHFVDNSSETKAGLTYYSSAHDTGALRKSLKIYTVDEHINLQPPTGKSIVVNDDSYDVDVRIESNGDANNIFSDGGNDRVGIGTNAPDVKFDVRGVSRFGASSTDYAEFEADGTLELNGAATVFNDLMVEMTPGRLGTLTKPDWDGTNIGFLMPQNDATEIIYIVVQMPHTWKVESTIYPHCHVQQAADQQAVMKMDYKWFDLGDAIPAGWTTYTMGTYSASYVSGTIHQKLKGTGIAGTGLGISSLLVIKLYRDDNVYTGDLLLQSFDIHYEIDTIGSRTELAK